MPDTLDNILDNILNSYLAYTQDPQYVYKKCRDDYIVILRKPLFVNTNENRKSVKNPSYAKFRADRLEVVLIFNAIEPTNTVTTAYSIYDYDFKYEVGKLINDTYDINSEVICGQGIHYFKTIQAAYYYEISPTMLTNHFGRYVRYHDNGNIHYSIEYGYMSENFMREDWDENGNKIHERSCDGKNAYECNYENGNKTYENISNENIVNLYYYKDGNKTNVYQYKDGIFVAPTE